MISSRKIFSAFFALKTFCSIVHSIQVSFDCQFTIEFLKAFLIVKASVPFMYYFHVYFQTITSAKILLTFHAFEVFSSVVHRFQVSCHVGLDAKFLRAYVAYELSHVLKFI